MKLADYRARCLELRVELRRDGWRVALVAATLVPFLPLWIASGARGAGSGDFSHVFIIPLMALGILWVGRDETVASVRGRRLPSRHFALAIWALGLGVRAVGYGMHEPLVEQAGFPLAMLGAIATLFGWDQGLRFAFPLLFLLFSFGFVSDLMLRMFTGILRFVGAGFAHDVLRTALPGRGPFGLNQTMILTRVGLFDVVEACSGVRGILALAVLGSIMGWRRKLQGWRALFFVALLFAMAVGGNLVRIAATLMTAVLAQGRWSFETIHGAWNFIAFGGCILLLPTVAKWIETCRPRVSAIRLLVLLLTCSYLLMVSVRASESGARVLERRNGNAIERTLVVQTPEVPAAYEVLVTPSKPDRYVWVLGSGLVHANPLHLVTNVIILFCLGEALLLSSGAWLPLLPLLAGQIVGAVTGFLTVGMTTSGAIPVFMGSSHAVSGLLGAYLLSLAMQRGLWPRLFAALLLLLFVGGLRGSQAFLQPPYRLLFGAHAAALLAGCGVEALTWACFKTKPTRPEGRVGSS